MVLSVANSPSIVLSVVKSPTEAYLHHQRPPHDMVLSLASTPSTPPSARHTVLSSLPTSATWFTGYFTRCSSCPPSKSATRSSLAISPRQQLSTSATWSLFWLFHHVQQLSCPSSTSSTVLPKTDPLLHSKRHGRKRNTA